MWRRRYLCCDAVAGQLCRPFFVKCLCRYPERPLSLPERRLTSIPANSGTPYIPFLAKFMPKFFGNFGMTLLKNRTYGVPEFAGTEVNRRSNKLKGLSGLYLHKHFAKNGRHSWPATASHQQHHNTDTVGATSITSTSSQAFHASYTFRSMSHLASRCLTAIDERVCAILERN